MTAKELMKMKAEFDLAAAVDAQFEDFPLLVAAEKTIGRLREDLAAAYRRAKDWNEEVR